MRFAVVTRPRPLIVQRSPLDEPPLPLGKRLLILLAVVLVLFGPGTLFALWLLDLI